MSWSTADIPDLSGHTAVVTGGNGGLGLETVRALAEAGAHVVIAARNQAKAVEAEAEVRITAPDASLEIVPLDLGSLASVRTAAEQIGSTHETIDILVNNAGLMALPERRTEDGFEMQFGVNHLGHWALTAMLIGPILAADAGRVVSITSTAQHMGRPVDPENPHLEGNYGPWKAYGQSKLANLHFAIGLQRQFDAAGVRTASLAAHPGLTNSDLQAHSAEESGGMLSKFSVAAANLTGMDVAQGALSQLRAATDPEARGGEFYGPLFVSNGPPVKKPIVRVMGMDKAIAKLWTVSERETGITLDVAGALSG